MIIKKYFKRLSSYQECNYVLTSTASENIKNATNTKSRALTKPPIISDLTYLKENTVTLLCNLQNLMLFLIATQCKIEISPIRESLVRSPFCN